MEVIGLKADVTSEEDIIQLINQAKDKYGRIDIFINNAGLQHVAPIEEFPTEKFELMIKIMLTAPFISIKNVLPIMKEQGFGRIINISSINGLIGFANKAAYNSAKHGVIGLTKVAALESASFRHNRQCPLPRIRRHASRPRSIGGPGKNKTSTVRKRFGRGHLSTCPTKPLTRCK